MHDYDDDDNSNETPTTKMIGKTTQVITPNDLS